MATDMVYETAGSCPNTPAQVGIVLEYLFLSFKRFCRRKVTWSPQALQSSDAEMELEAGAAQVSTPAATASATQDSGGAKVSRTSMVLN